MTTPEQLKLVEGWLSGLEGDGLTVDRISARRGGCLHDALRALLREREEQAREIHKLRASMVEHFSVEHLQGDGPEIDRWKRKLAEAQREIERIRSAYERSHSAQEYDRAQARVAELEAALREKDREIADSHALIYSHEGHIEKLEAQLQAIDAAVGPDEDGMGNVVVSSVLDRVRSWISAARIEAHHADELRAQLADEQEQHRRAILRDEEQLQAEREAHERLKAKKHSGHLCIEEHWRDQYTQANRDRDRLDHENAALKADMAAETEARKRAACGDALFHGIAKGLIGKILSRVPDEWVDTPGDIDLKLESCIRRAIAGQVAEEKLRQLLAAAELACDEHEKEDGTQCADCTGMVELRAALLADQKEEKRDGNA